MKNIFINLCFVVGISLCACSSNDSDNSLLSIDVNTKYPKIQLNLKDIADIEYIKIASDSNFLVSSRTLVFNDNHIITKGSQPGEILLFDRQGNPLNKFSHYGNGPHEYNYITNLRIDEIKQEIYIHDIFSQKIIVYDLMGNFIREYPTGDERYIYNYNNNAFITYNTETNKIDPTLRPYYSIVSKKNGSILNKIDIPFPAGKRHELAVTKKQEGGSFTYTAMHLPLIRYSEGYILNELSSDTIYKYSFGGILSPFIVRTPAIHSMSTPTYLEMGVETGRYIFMTQVSIDENNKDNMFPSANWVYDKQTQSLHEYEIVNEDYPDNSIILDAHILNCDIQEGYALTRFNAGDLVDAYDKGKLHGQLKEIASTLNEEDNDVLMLLKLK